MKCSFIPPWRNLVDAPNLGLGSGKELRVQISSGVLSAIYSNPLDSVNLFCVILLDNSYINELLVVYRSIFSPLRP